MKVLIVDDEEDVRNIARLSLGRVGGMDVVEAASGAEGVAAAIEHQPDLVVLDMMMPGMDGEATFQELRARPETRDIPVIFLTAKAVPSDVERLGSMGAAGVILKPFNPMTLAAEVRAILGEKA